MSSDTNMDLKYRFDIAAFPTLIMLKNDKYFVYTGNMTEAELLVYIESTKRAAGGSEIPPAKTPFEILKLQTRDNLVGLSRMADFFGLKNLRIRYKVLVSIVILLTPIILAIVYTLMSKGKATAEDKDKKE